MLNRICQGAILAFACTFSLFLGLAQAQNSATFPSGGGGTPGGSNTQVQFNSSSSFGGSANLTWVSPALTLGVQQTTAGQLVLANAAAGAFATTIRGSDSATAAWTLTLPTTAGTNLQVLQTNGSGVTSWATAGSGGCTENCTITETAGNTALTLTGATQTASHPVLSMTQTWNNGATAFTGLLHNITNSASSSTAKLIDFQVGGNSYLSANTDGSVLINQRTAALALNPLDVKYNDIEMFNVETDGTKSAININNKTGLGLNFANPNGAINFAGAAHITNPSGAIIALPDIATDAAHTTSTVCQDTTTHGLYFGSGTVGICLGTSSMRFKHDIRGLDVGLKEVMKVKPIIYRYNEGYGDPNQALYGFTAEQMVSAVPKLVRYGDDGKPQSVDYMGMVPVLVKAVQELKADNDNLRAELRALKTVKHAKNN